MVANLANLRILLTIVVRDDLELEQVGFVSVFLNGDLDTNVYLKQPEGFTINDEYILPPAENSLWSISSRKNLVYSDE